VKSHVLILGAGFGGLELATRLSETASDAVRVTLLDRNDSFYFGFSKLEVMLGRQSADAVRLPYRDIAKEGVEFRQETVIGIDPVARRVMTDIGTYDADFLVVAMGADYDIAATPGLEEGGHHYYSLAGAERLRDALSDFDGGRVLVSVLGQPFKCPPAPFEGSFLLHEHFTERGMRDAVHLATTFPMQGPVPVTGEVSQMFRDALAARGIEELPQQLVTSIDPAAKVARLANGETLPYDLFVGIPVHHAPEPLAASGLAIDGWVPVDQTNLRTGFPNVYALGDVCKGPRTVPKAGIFAESAARVVAEDIAAQISGGDPPAPYEATGICYAEFGGGLVGKVQVNFLRGESAVAEPHDPSREYAAEKAEFGAARRARWFGMTTSPPADSQASSASP
jgi:sulfide:quinone oxidoreductase